MIRVATMIYRLSRCELDGDRRAHVADDDVFGDETCHQVVIAQQRLLQRQLFLDSHGYIPAFMIPL